MSERVLDESAALAVHSLGERNDGRGTYFTIRCRKPAARSGITQQQANMQLQSLAQHRDLGATQSSEAPARLWMRDSPNDQGNMNLRVYVNRGEAEFYLLVDRPDRRLLETLIAEFRPTEKGSIPCFIQDLSDYYVWVTLIISESAKAEAVAAVVEEEITA